MRRREFVGLLGAATVVSPLRARAQERARMRLIGVLQPGALNDRIFQRHAEVFEQEPARLGGGGARMCKSYSVGLPAIASCTPSPPRRQSNPSS
jgi:hypothetical protein